MFRGISFAISIALCALARPSPAAAQAASQHDAAVLAEADVRRDSTPRVGQPPADEPNAGERKRAAELTARAASAFRAQRFEAAAQLFERAYAIIPVAPLQFNLGQCYRQLNRDAEAREAFNRYLSARPDAPEREQIEHWMRERGTQPELPVAQAPFMSPAPAVPAARDAALDRALGEPSRDRALTEPARPVHEAARDDNSPTVFERWWFWTAVGVVAAGSVTAALVLDHQDSQPPPAGTLGTVRWN